MCVVCVRVRKKSPLRPLPVRAARAQSLRPSRGAHKALSWTHPRCAQARRDATVLSLPKAMVSSLPTAV
eukprot:317792-Prymnesium_polylepis.1